MDQQLKNDLIFIHKVISYSMDIKQFEGLPLDNYRKNFIKDFVLRFIYDLKCGKNDAVLFYCVNNGIAINKSHYKSIRVLDTFIFDFDILDYDRNLCFVGRNFLTSAVLDPSILEKFVSDDIDRLIKVSYIF